MLLVCVCDVSRMHVQFYTALHSSTQLDTARHSSTQLYRSHRQCWSMVGTMVNKRMQQHLRGSCHRGGPYRAVLCISPFTGWQVTRGCWPLHAVWLRRCWQPGVDGGGGDVRSPHGLCSGRGRMQHREPFPNWVALCCRWYGGICVWLRPCRCCHGRHGRGCFKVHASKRSAAGGFE